jgi:MFS family permease
MAMAAAVSFSGAWFWQIHTRIPTVFLYYAVWFLTMLAVFAWGQARGGRIGRRRIHTGGLAAGIACMGVFAGLGPASRSLVFPLAILTGLSGSLYWLALYIAGAEELSQGQGRWFNAWIGVVESGASLVAPPLAGAIIAALPGLSGYRWVFGGATVLLGAALALVLSSPTRGGEVRTARSPRLAVPERLRALAPALFLLGLRDGALFFLPGLLLFIVTSRALLLGTYSAAVAGIQTAAFAMMSRPATERHLVQLRRGACTITVLSTLSFAVLPLVPAIFLYGCLGALVYPVYKVQLESYALHAIQASSRHSGDQVTLTSRKELWINGGRVTAFALLWMIAVVSISDLESALTWTLAAWGTLTIALHWQSREIASTSP